jgi:hypothetical protein
LLRQDIYCAYAAQPFRQLVPPRPRRFARPRLGGCGCLSLSRITLDMRQA